MKTRSYIIVTLVLIILRPHINVDNQQLAVYLGDFLLIFLIFMYYISNKITIPIKFKRVFFGLIITLLFFAIITLIHLSINGFHVNFIIDYFKIVYYLIFLVYALDILIKNDFNINKIIRILFYLNLIVALVQTFSPPYIKQMIEYVYGSIKLRDIYTGNPRIYGAFYNANWFGVYLIFYVAFLVSHLKNLQFIYIDLSFVIFLIFLTASRGALLGVLIIFILYGVKNFNLKSIFQIILLIVLGFIIINRQRRNTGIRVTDFIGNLYKCKVGLHFNK